jgi:N6-adenosine-specific RNA methylase IME4/ParB-like chromosome segregation protein Spo0J
MTAALPHHPLAAIFPLLDGDEFAALVADIRAHGLRQRIVLHEGMILDGRNRYAACRVAGIEPRFEAFNGADPLAFVVSLNLARRHLNESQRAIVAAKIASLRDGQRQVGQLAEVPTQGQAAILLNVGERTIRRAREVLDEGAPELIEKVERGEISVSAAVEVAHLPALEQREIVARGEKEILAGINARKYDEKKLMAVARTNAVEFNAKELGKFAVIYADPPWRYETPEMGGPSRRTENHYPTMTLDEICALPVADIAHEDSILFLWATAPKLAESMQAVESWGFTYRTCMVWAKDKFGLSYYVRNQHEHLLICKRGEMPPPPDLARCSSLVVAPRLEHSAKPPVFYDIIDEMFPVVRKIELFSRAPRKGWETWGNQASGRGNGGAA